MLDKLGYDVELTYKKKYEMKHKVKILKRSVNIWIVQLMNFRKYRKQRNLKRKISSSSEKLEIIILNNREVH